MSPLTLSRDGLEFVAMINPAELKRSVSLDFGSTKPAGAKAGRARLSRAGEESFSFSLVVDATGVVPARGEVLPMVDAQMRRLRAVLGVSERSGADVVAPPVKLLWGTLVRELRLRSLRVAHVLFTPEGVPLRARVDLALCGPFRPALAAEASPGVASGAAAEGAASQVQARDGDTLDKLCREAYGDAFDPAELARINDLPSLRGPLPAGTVIVLPPLARAA